MKIGKRDTRKQNEAGESNEPSDKHPQCSKCGKKLASTDTTGVCKRCTTAAQRRRARILGAITVGGVVVKKYGPKAMSLAMKVIKK